MDLRSLKQKKKKPTLPQNPSSRGGFSHRGRSPAASRARPRRGAEASGGRRRPLVAGGGRRRAALSPPARPGDGRAGAGAGAAAARRLSRPSAEGAFACFVSGGEGGRPGGRLPARRDRRREEGWALRQRRPRRVGDPRGRAAARQVRASSGSRGAAARVENHGFV